MNREELNLKYAIDAVQDSYEVWAWADGSKTPIKFKYAMDGYDLGIHKKDFDPKAPLKIISVTTKKEPDGISGSVRFTKGKTSFSEPFMVYKSGNWDRKPIDGYSFPPTDREALLNAVRKKLMALNIKAK